MYILPTQSSNFILCSLWTVIGVLVCIGRKVNLFNSTPSCRHLQAGAQDLHHETLCDAVLRQLDGPSSCPLSVSVWKPECPSSSTHAVLDICFASTNVHSCVICAQSWDLHRLSHKTCKYPSLSCLVRSRISSVSWAIIILKQSIFKPISLWR